VIAAGFAIVWRIVPPFYFVANACVLGDHFMGREQRANGTRISRPP
jgi:hypothetical protein